MHQFGWLLTRTTGEFRYGYNVLRSMRNGSMQPNHQVSRIHESIAGSWACDGSGNGTPCRGGWNVVLVLSGKRDHDQVLPGRWCDVSCRGMHG
jgi:hypothetical protein